MWIVIGTGLVLLYQLLSLCQGPPLIITIVYADLYIDSDGYQTYYTVPITGLSLFMAFARQDLD